LWISTSHLIWDLQPVSTDLFDLILEGGEDFLQVNKGSSEHDALNDMIRHQFSFYIDTIPILENTYLCGEGK